MARIRSRNASALLALGWAAACACRVMAAEPDQHWIDIDQDITLPPGQIISGHGVISAAVVNQGAVIADVYGDSLVLLGADKINFGRIIATEGGILDASGMAVMQGSEGRIEAAQGGHVELNGAAIVGGVISSDASSSVLAVGGTNSLRDVRIEGTLGINALATVEVGGTSLINNGRIVVNQNVAGGTPVLRFVSNVQLDGTGEIVLNNMHINAQLDTAAGVTVVQGADHSIRGRGQVRAAIVNNGVIESDVPQEVLYLVVKDKVNNGLIRAMNGARLDIKDIRISQGDSGTIMADGGDVLLWGRTSIEGGRLSSTGRSSVALFDANATLKGVRNEGLLTIGSGSKATITGGMANAGTVTVRSGMLDLAAGTFDQGSEGRIEAAQGGHVELNGAAIVGGVISSDASSSVLAVGGTNSLRDVRIEGTLGINALATVEVGGTSLINNGRIVVNQNVAGGTPVLRFVSNVQLDGTGEIVLNNMHINAQLDTAAGVTVVQGADHSIRGRGQVRAAIVNNGVIESDVPQEVLYLVVKDKVNNGLIRAMNGARLDIKDIRISQGDSGTIMADGGDVLLWGRTSIEGGRLSSTGRSSVALFDANATLKGVRNEGLLTIGSGSKATITGGMANAGTVQFQYAKASTHQIVADRITNSGTFDQAQGWLSITDRFVNAAGSARLGGAQQWSPGATLDVTGGSVELAADLGSPVAHNAHVAVSGQGSLHIAASQHLASLSITSGVATLADTACISLDSLNLDGMGTLDLSRGRLIVRNHSDAAPDVLSQLLADIAQGRAGEGLVTTAPGQDESGASMGLWAVVNDNGSGKRIHDSFGGQPTNLGDVLVGYTIRGDLDLDGQVGTSDFGLLSLGYVSSRLGDADHALIADLSLDGVIDIEDFKLLSMGYIADQVNRHAAFRAAATGVPEPGTVLATTLAAGLLLARKRRF